MGTEIFVESSILVSYLLSLISYLLAFSVRDLYAAQGQAVPVLRWLAFSC